MFSEIISTLAAGLDPLGLLTKSMQASAAHRQRRSRDTAATQGLEKNTSELRRPR